MLRKRVKPLAFRRPGVKDTVVRQPFQADITKHEFSLERLAYLISGPFRIQLSLIRCDGAPRCRNFSLDS